MLPLDVAAPWIEHALDLSSRRGSLIRANLANVDTPDYVPTDLDFEEALRAELRHRAHFGPMPGEPMSHKDESVQPSLDGNRVDLDREMTRAMANRMFFELGTEVISRKFNMMRYAIDEGGRT